MSDVRRWRQPKYLDPSEAGMSFALSDPDIDPRPQYANLQVRAWRDERPSVEIVFSWLGNSGGVPLAVQRQMVRATTGLLQQLRAACLPAASDAVECVAEGLGRRKACAATPAG